MHFRRMLIYISLFGTLIRTQSSCPGYLGSEQKFPGNNRLGVHTFCRITLALHSLPNDRSRQFGGLTKSV